MATQSMLPNEALRQLLLAWVGDKYRNEYDRMVGGTTLTYSRIISGPLRAADRLNLFRAMVRLMETQPLLVTLMPELAVNPLPTEAVTALRVNVQALLDLPRFDASTETRAATVLSTFFLNTLLPRLQSPATQQTLVTYFQRVPPEGTIPAFIPREIDLTRDVPPLPAILPIARLVDEFDRTLWQTLLVEVVQTNLAYLQSTNTRAWDDYWLGRTVRKRIPDASTIPALLKGMPELVAAGQGDYWEDLQQPSMAALFLTYRVRPECRETLRAPLQGLARAGVTQSGKRLFDSSYFFVRRDNVIGFLLLLEHALQALRNCPPSASSSPTTVEAATTSVVGV